MLGTQPSKSGFALWLSHLKKKPSNLAYTSQSWVFHEMFTFLTMYKTIPSLFLVKIFAQNSTRIDFMFLRDRSGIWKEPFH